MKQCPNCHAQLDDSALFCHNCGSQFTAGAQNAAPQQEQPQYQQQYQYQQTPYQQPPQYQQPPYQQPPYQQPQPDLTDHTAEFEAQDISDNKVFAMVGYLMGALGIVIALLASHKSDYTMFHVRQALKLTVIEALLILATTFLFWTILVPIAAGVCLTIVLVLRIICFVQVCKGRAKEPPIVHKFGFLK